MTFDAHESSAHDGTPKRLFLFTIGNVTMAYVEGVADTYLGIDYESVALVQMADIEQSLSESSPNIEITIDSATPLVAQFIPYQPTTIVGVRVYRRHFEDGDVETYTELIGEVVSGRIDQETDTAVLTVRMLASAFDRIVPWPAYQKQCNYVPYGPGCQVDPNLFKTETTLVNVTNNRIASPDFAAKAGAEADPEWFTLGYVVRVLDGQKRFVIRQLEDVLVLQSPFVGMQAGDAVEAFAGDNLLKSTCEGKFNNLPRFMGFPWGPSKNPFTDNVLGTGSPAGAGGPTNSDYVNALVDAFNN
jgi:uncharacterized phage protein (TIGR02218 family)